MLDRLYSKHVLLLAPVRQEFDHALSRRSFFFGRQVDHHSVSAHVCVPKLKLGRSGDEVRPGWRVTRPHRLAEPGEKPARP
jgi:hypothetical protein